MRLWWRCFAKSDGENTDEGRGINAGVNGGLEFGNDGKLIGGGERFSRIKLSSFDGCRIQVMKEYFCGFKHDVVYCESFVGQKTSVDSRLCGKTYGSLPLIFEVGIEFGEAITMTGKGAVGVSE